jgi:hypothetical protein
MSRENDGAAALPTPVWGRDARGAGAMWNSNSVIAWLLARSGLAAARRPGAPIRRPALTAILDGPAGWRSGRTHRS